MEGINQTIPVSQLTDWMILSFILSNADENMNVWENGQIVAHLDGTREEWLVRIEDLRKVEQSVL